VGHNKPEYDVSYENMQTMVSRTILALFRSVAVISMKTFLVLSVIFVWSPLIIGGIDSTIPFLSRITGYRGLSRMIGR